MTQPGRADRNKRANQKMNSSTIRTVNRLNAIIRDEKHRQTPYDPDVRAWIDKRNKLLIVRGPINPTPRK
jgi:hypothetical protein